MALRKELSTMTRFSETLERLLATILARKSADAATSYTAALLRDPARAAKKFGEEAVETVIAAILNDKEALVSESADLLYHWLVLIAALDVSPDDVAAALTRREGVSGLVEKANRPKPSET
jgi:phosphoribosyl-ATP pyrophosphohydrolase